MNTYQLIVGSGTDVDDGLEVYVSGAFDTLCAAVSAAEDLPTGDKLRSWIDVTRDGAYVEHFDLTDPVVCRKAGE